MGKPRLKHIKQIVQGPTAREWQNQDLNSGSLIPKTVLLNMMSSMKPLWCSQIEMEMEIEVEIKIEIIQKRNGNNICYNLFSGQQSQNLLWNINLSMPLAFSKLTCNKTQVLYSQPPGPCRIWPLDASPISSFPWFIMPLPPTSFIFLKPANGQGLDTCCCSLLECTATDICVASSSFHSGL